MKRRTSSRAKSTTSKKHAVRKPTNGKSTPRQRMLTDLEKQIETLRRDIAAKEREFTRLKALL